MSPRPEATRSLWGALLALWACTVPALELEGKVCSAADPCPEPYRCAVPTGATTGTCTAGERGGVRVSAAGYIACPASWPDFNDAEGTPGGCRMKATAAVVEAHAAEAVLLLGNAQMSGGSLEEYTHSFERGWGRFKSITYPVPGGHDYFTGQAQGYFSYFGARAGPPAKGYYSFDLGGWHLIALNSECAEVGGCGAGSLQEQWLRADLAAHPALCTLAFWSEPRFSSRRSDVAYDAFWRALHEAGAELVLNAGVKQYERLAPLAPDGGADPGRGIREFVVGTGGLGGFDAFNALLPATESAKIDSFGVLQLTLRDGGYDFRFAATAEDPFTDEGSGACH